MKKISLIAGLMAFGAIAFIGTAAHAQTSSSPGDLMLAFQAQSGQGAAVTLEVDLGSLTNFLPGGTYATGSPYSLTQLAVADISSEYGSNWNSLTSLDWAVFGTNVNSTFGGLVPVHHTVFGTLQLGDSTPVGDNSTAATGESNKINTVVVTDFNNSPVTAHSNFATDSANTDTSNFAGESGGSSPFFNVSAFDAAFQNTTNGTQSLNLWEIAPAAQGTDLGQFTLSSGGLTFESPASVPEPSTWATILVGAATLIGFRRRRMA